MDSTTLPKPGHPAIRIGERGDAHLRGYRCNDCGGVFAEPTMACRRCGSRAVPEAFDASETGTLHTWSVVQRSYPGVAVPFVSAIVDLDDGLTLKGTLRDCAPEDLRMGLSVRAVIDDAGGATDKDGTPYAGFHFIPAGGGQ